MWQYVMKAKVQRNGSKDIKLGGVRVEFPDWMTLRVTFKEIFIDRSYDIALNNAQPLIIDCGSNIGMSITFFKKRYPGARIIGFEPDPVTFRCLANNVSRNFLNVTVHNLALSDRAGTLTFSGAKDKDNSTISTSFKELLGDLPASSIEVRSDRLSEYINETVDLLKLDVEGAEELVLGDLGSTGKLALIKRMIIEHHALPNNPEHHLPTFLQTLEREGFSYTVFAQPRLSEGQLDPSPVRAVFIYTTRDSERLS
jgi:FkbM family methyltransferase